MRKRSGRCERSSFAMPRAPRSAVTAARSPRCAPTTLPRFRSRRWSPAIPRPTGRGSTKCFSAAPIRPARTTAMSRAWRSCSPGCLNSIPGITVNRLCASGLNAVGDAARAIRSGEMDFAIAGGVESMTRAPFVMGKAGEAFSRAAEIYDTTLGWRFINPVLKAQYGVDSMAETGENVAEEFQVTRADQDAFALRSQAARRQGRRRRLFRRGDRSGRGAGRQSRADRRRQGRASASRHHARKSAKAQTDRAQSRHHHGRQCVGHQ